MRVSHFGASPPFVVLKSSHFESQCWTGSTAPSLRTIEVRRTFGRSTESNSQTAGQPGKQTDTRVRAGRGGIKATKWLPQRPAPGARRIPLVTKIISLRAAY